MCDRRVDVPLIADPQRELQLETQALTLCFNKKELEHVCACIWKSEREREITRENGEDGERGRIKSQTEYEEVGPMK